MTTPSSTKSASPTVATVAGWQYQGCFVDETVDARILTGPQFTDDSMTPEFCRDKCMVNGNGFFGVQFATQCFCSSTLKTDARKASSELECNNPCNGNKNVVCGAAFRMNVYSASARALPAATGSVQTCPPPAAMAGIAIGAAFLGGCLSLGFCFLIFWLRQRAFDRRMKDRRSYPLEKWHGAGAAGPRYNKI